MTYIPAAPGTKFVRIGGTYHSHSDEQNLKAIAIAALHAQPVIAWHFDDEHGSSSRPTAMTAVGPIDEDFTKAWAICDAEDHVLDSWLGPYEYVADWLEGLETEFEVRVAKKEAAE
jgi:hypothetical protein